MSDINFHIPYQGREDNRYTFEIQKLYEYQYLLQEITKELHKILKKMPEYRNINNATINLEINEITNHFSFDRNLVTESNILKSVIQKKNKAKNENIYLFNLVAARKILLERIPILESNIKSLPVPQNSNDGYSNNEEPNYNKPLAKLKPKLKTNKKMTEKEKLKMIRKGAEKLLSKKYRETNLVKNTYLRNKAENNNFLDKQREEEYDERMLQQYLINEYGQNNNSNRMGWNTQNNHNNQNYYRPISPPYRPRLVSTINGHSYFLSAREANAHNDGLFNQISVPVPVQQRYRSTKKSSTPSKSSKSSKSNNSGTNDSFYSSKSSKSNNSGTNYSFYSSKSSNSSNSENLNRMNNSSTNNSDKTRSLNHRTKFFSNEESNSGYLSNSPFLSSRYKRTGKTKSKQGILEFKNPE